MVESEEFKDYNEALKYISTHADDIIRLYSLTHSPSEKFADIGRDWVDGLVEGIQDSESKLKDALIELAAVGMDEFKDAFDLSSIRPVAELGETSNYGYLSKSVPNGYLYNSLRAAQNISDYASENGGHGMVVDNRQITNTFTITGNDPKAIADEVAIILEEYVDGRDRVYGNNYI